MTNNNYFIEKNLSDFKNIKEVKTTPQYSVFIAVEQQEGKKVFVKIPSSEENTIFVEREHANQLFLYKLSQTVNCGFAFLPPRMHGDALIYPYISDRIVWLGQTSPEKQNFRPQIEPIAEYLDQVILLQKALLNVDFDTLPEFVKNDWRDRKTRLQNNLNNDAISLYNNGLITSEEQTKAAELVALDKITWNYQHHDLVPWHMGKIDDTLFLVDAGWAGWSMRYFDIVYYALQMIGYANRKEDSIKMLDRVKNEFANDKNISENIRRVAWYRGIRLARELHKRRKYPKGAHQVLEFIRGYDY